VESRGMDRDVLANRADIIVKNKKKAEPAYWLM
jgi:hypothetical protein